MRTRFLTSSPALLLALAHLGCGEAQLETGDTVASEQAALSSTISWTSSNALVYPQASNYASVKDPTVVYDNGKYHVYATVYNTSASTWQMIYFNFTDWSQANNAAQYSLNQVSGFSGYNCAPEVFYFPPHNKWYLIYQSQQPRYSTANDLSQPSTWTAPQNMFTTTPSGMPSLPIDYYVICDDTNCHMFLTGDDGKLYRTQTSIANFPNGWGSVSVVLTYPTSVLFEGSSHYKILGENTYLTVVEGMGSNGRWFAGWTASNLAGPWTEFKVNQSTPWAGLANVSFTGSQWTNDISHGEMMRYQNDAKSVLDPNNMQFVYQGRDPASGGAYELLPYRLGLLTAVGATGGPPGGVGGGGASVYLEAECGSTEVGAYATNSTSKAGYSGSGHLMSVGNTAAMTYDGTSTDRATYSFSATSGTYTPYFRFDSDGDYANDSFFYRVNGGAWTMMNGFAASGPDWAWVAGTGGNVTLNGSSTIEIANREDGLGIDKIALVPSGSAAPSGSGGTANNCAVMFQMSGGTVSMEAENYDAKFAATGSTDAWSNNAGVMECLPNDNTTWTTNVHATAPRMEYKVNFTTTGTFYLHVKAAGANGGDDSVHAGLDGAVVDDTIAVNATNVLSWAHGTAFTVSSTGLHTVIVYAREDGVRVDQVIVNQSSGTPTWTGQSPRN
jgi:hypothetical protein